MTASPKLVRIISKYFAMSPNRTRPFPFPINDIAREAGVSITTVSRVFHQPAAVSEKTSGQVRAAIERLEKKNRADQPQPSNLRKQVIGVVLPELSGTYFSRLLYGIQQGAYESGYDLLVYASRDIDLHGQQDIPFLGEQVSDGWIVFTQSIRDDALASMARRKFPVVLLHRSSPPGLHIPVILFQNQTAAAQLVDHLIEVHHRRHIVFLSGPEGNEDSFEREQGFLLSLAKHGIQHDPALSAEGGFEASIAESAILDLLDRGAFFDAVFAGDDNSAAGVLSALNQRRLRVPEDVSVVGFDDDLLAPYLPVPLTTVHAPVQDAGLEAVRQLIHLIETGAATLISTLPTHPVFRRSCGCHP